MSTVKNQIDRNQVWELLEYIPAYDRDTWIKVGMALKSEFGDGGFALYDEWSKRADNYNSNAVIHAWRSFK